MALDELLCRLLLLVRQNNNILPSGWQILQCHESLKIHHICAGFRPLIGDPHSVAFLAYDEAELGFLLQMRFE